MHKRLTLSQTQRRLLGSEERFIAGFGGCHPNFQAVLLGRGWNGKPERRCIDASAANGSLVA